jgi:SAM-dependent methyltransferase
LVAKRTQYNWALMAERSAVRRARTAGRAWVRRARKRRPGGSADEAAGADPRTGIPLLDRERIERKALLEDEHWWYRGRRRIVLERIERLPLPRHSRILDAGCGSGALLSHLRRFGTVTGVDLNPLAVEYARNRRGGEVSTGSIDRLPFGARAFDLVTCLDVLEHVADDRRAFAELRRVTATGGFVLATVPAYPGLWSPHDVAAGHARRYRRGQLCAAAAEAGWRPVLETHFMALLLPLVACVRIAARLRGGPPRSHLDVTPRAIGRLLGLPLRAEAAAIRRGLRLPVGLSILAIFENPSRAG